MKVMKAFCTALRDVEDGASIMIGGFLCCGQPFGLIDALLEKGVKNLTIICNDGGYPNKGVGKLICEGRVKKLITSHIGLNPIAGEKMNSKELEVVLVPQGTLAERIRAYGAGLGGILTPTGIGTAVEHGKTKLSVNSKEFIVEEALGADFAFIAAHEADGYGNLYIEKSAINFNIVMAMAAKTTIVETRKFVSIGDINPNIVTVPGVFVHRITQGG